MPKPGPTESLPLSPFKKSLLSNHGDEQSSQFPHAVLVEDESDRLVSCAKPQKHIQGELYSTAPRDNSTNPIFPLRVSSPMPPKRLSDALFPIRTSPPELLQHISHETKRKELYIYTYMYIYSEI